mgnify:CR=1 FL=1
MINTLLKEKSVWEKLMVTRKPIILYGMGDGADRVLQEFELLNIHASGVMASDDFVRGQSFHKFTEERIIVPKYLYLKIMFMMHSLTGLRRAGKPFPQKIS